MRSAPVELRQANEDDVPVISCSFLVFADVLECGSNPCLNGATCMEGTNAFLCNCDIGWEGTNCETGKLDSHSLLGHSSLIH